MFQKFLVGVMATVTLSAMALTSPEYVGKIAEHSLVTKLVETLNSHFGIDSLPWVNWAILFSIFFLVSIFFLMMVHVVGGKIAGRRKSLNRDIALIFDAIDNGRDQMIILENELRMRKFGDINTRAFDKIGHARRILDALEHRARQLVPHYKNISKSNFEHVRSLFDTPLKFSVSCVNSVRDTQAIEVIPEIHPMEAVVKLDLLFNGIRKEIEAADARVIENEIKNAERANEDAAEQVLLKTVIAA